VRKADNLTTFMSLNFQDPLRTPKTYVMIALPLLCFIDQNKEVNLIFDQGKKVQLSRRGLHRQPCGL
jgi:hypothetical protein